MMYLSVSDLTKNLLFLTWFLLKVCDVSSFAVESADYTASTESVDNSESSEETAANFTVKDHKAQAQSVGVFSPQAAGKYEVRSISGEPNYKSVNLTWDMDFVPLTAKDVICNSTDNGEPPKAFQIFICEMQTFGPHRCRAKVVDIPGANQDDNMWHKARHYMARIDNLRMATKYSFHVRPQFRRRNLKVMGRSEIFHNNLEEEDSSGHTIIIPTKGFAAEATKCLPNASEIQVETGPYFGGKIMVDGGKCMLRGNPSNPSDVYTMRIDHSKCGSMIKPDTNTVETFITVQENLGIFTHSTRRFVVVCSYQSGMQTVRASFSVPGRGGATAVEDIQKPSDDERRGRGLKPLRYVGKASLVRKEQSELFLTDSPETEATVQEMTNTEEKSRVQKDQAHTNATLPVLKVNHYNISQVPDLRRGLEKDVRYDKFILDDVLSIQQRHPGSLRELRNEQKNNFTGETMATGRLLMEANFGAITASLILSVGLIVGLLCVLQRIKITRRLSTTAPAMKTRCTPLQAPRKQQTC